MDGHNFFLLAKLFKINLTLKNLLLCVTFFKQLCVQLLSLFKPIKLTINQRKSVPETHQGLTTYNVMTVKSSFVLFNCN